MANCSDTRINSTDCRPSYPNEDEAKLWMIFFLFNTPVILIGILTIISNGMVLFVFLRTRRLQMVTNFFLAAIACSDLLMGLVGVPTFIACNATYGYVKYVCESHSTFFAFASLCTISFIAVITADRYIAILMSLRYNVLMTKRRAKIIIAVVFMVMLVLSVLPYFWVSGVRNTTADQRRADIIYTICILLPIVIAFPLMVYAYCKIFIEIRKQHKLTHEHERLAGKTTSSVEKEVRTIIVFVVMMAAYVFCWTPLGVIRVNLYISKSYGVLSYAPRYILQSLPFVTSFINPCCYGLGKKDFRNALNQTVKCTRGRSDNGQRYRQPEPTATTHF